MGRRKTAGEEDRKGKKGEEKVESKERYEK